MYKGNDTSRKTSVFYQIIVSVSCPSMKVVTRKSKHSFRQVVESKIVHPRAAPGGIPALGGIEPRPPKPRGPEQGS
jgi:hypothetical protein